MSKPPPDLSNYSLDEFQEFERLIRENTAPDSDEEEQDTSISTSTSLKQVVGETLLHGDTGYQSASGLMAGLEMLHTPEIEENSKVSNISDNSANSQSHSTSLRTHLVFDSDSSQEDDASDKPVSGQNLVLDLNLSTVEKDQNFGNHVAEEGERKEVATFGTTEKLEALLKQQLENTDEDGSENGALEQVDDEKLTRVVGLISSPPLIPKAEQPYQRRSLDSRTTRSPAANRVRKANKSKSWSSKSLSPAHPESSDDLSVRSDASRNELRKRLRKLHTDRTKEHSFTQQLQNDYDDALTKFVEAENVIDQLRIGAKIDLLAQLPTEEGESVKESHHGRKSPPDSQKPTFNTSRISQDDITDNSLKLPRTASLEFLRIALEHQVNELNDQIKSFKELLKEGHIEDIEKRQVLNSIVAALNRLRGDYIRAGMEYEAENRRVVLSGNAKDVELESFDPERKIEGKIFKLDSIVENLKANIYFGPSLPQTPTSSRKFLNSECQDFESSDSTLDISGDFGKRLCRRKGHSIASNAEGHTTASSHYPLSDEDAVGYPDDANSPKPMIPPAGGIVRKQLLGPRSVSNTSVSKDAVHQFLSNADTGGMKSGYSVQKFPRQKTSRLPKSRLPRPVVRLRRKKAPLKISLAGSESSHQSSSAIPLKHELRFQKSSLVHSEAFTAPDQQPVHRESPEPTEILHTNGSAKPTAASTTRAASFSDERRAHRKQSSSDEMEPEMGSPWHDKAKEFQSWGKSGGGNTWSSISKPTAIFAEHINPYGSTGDQMFSSMAFHNNLHQGPSLAEKPRTNSRRSVASSAMSNTFELLRTEIAQLRQEVREKMTDALVTSPKTAEKIFSEVEQGYNSESEDTESQSARERQPTVSREKGSPQNSCSVSGDSVSSPSMHAMQSTSLRPGSSAENSHNPDLPQESEDSHLKTRDAKTGGDSPITVEVVDNTSIAQAHLKSIPPFFSFPHASSIRYVPVPTLYSPHVFVQAPTLKTNPTYHRQTRSCHFPARIYIPVLPYNSGSCKSVPVKARTYLKRGSFCMTPPIVKQPHLADENEQPLTRSKLTSTKSFSSVSSLHQSFLDSQLSMSLERAERATNSLRQNSRAMYRSLRDSLYKAELLSSALA